MKLFISFGILVGVVSFSKATIWASEDTIAIDAETPKVKREIFGYDAVVKTSSCSTIRGHQGTCTTFQDCYPGLFFVKRNATSDDAPFNPTLAEMIVETTGYCDMPSSAVRIIENFNLAYQSEILVCCPVPEVENPNASVFLLSPPSKNNTTDTNKAPRSCGKMQIEFTSQMNETASEQDRIVGGRDAYPGEFPWSVALMNRGRQFCGGSLINSEWILTAAHCVHHMGSSDVANLLVQIGDHDIYTSTEAKSVNRKVSRVLYHKGFTMKNLHHDIGLLKLSSPVTYAKNIQPVCLHQGSNVDDLNSDVAGWGQLCDNCGQPQTLKTASVKIWKQEDCKKKYAKDLPSGIGEGMVCSGGSGKDSCRGDSGGGLTIDSKENAQLVGIVSFGIGCGDYPGVYTRVSSYRDWIKKNSGVQF